jgi:hypothetical protein
MQRHGNNWLYWSPRGNWLIYQGGSWIPYSAETYVAPSYAPAVQAIYPGPYYYDQNGFYYIIGGAKVYQPQIQFVQ